ncbi:MAG: M14 family zinc carboxypeptidase, partial [Elusimicrobiota bacterium]
KPEIDTMLANKDIYITPMMNPDGAEYDYEDGSYRMWRKNRSSNSDGSKGVDLNRNYGYQWGKEGSSPYPNSDTFRGEGPFSEPETQRIRDFIDSKPNIKILMSYHSFSELILWPPGYTYEPLPNLRDRQVFETMGKT